MLLPQPAGAKLHGAHPQALLLQLHGGAGGVGGPLGRPPGRPHPHPHPADAGHDHPGGLVQ